MPLTIEDIKVVEQHYTFPFQLHNYQYVSILEAVTKGDTLERAKAGVGKRIISMYSGL